MLSAGPLVKLLLDMQGSYSSYCHNQESTKDFYNFVTPVKHNTQLIEPGDPRCGCHANWQVNITLCLLFRLAHELSRRKSQFTSNVQYTAVPIKTVERAVALL